MRTLVWALAIFALAVALTLAAKYNAGLVLLLYPPYRIELSLNLFIVLLLAAFFIAYGLLRLGVMTLRLPAYVRNFKQQRRRDKARTALQLGLLAWYEGRYARAEKFAATALEFEEPSPLPAIVAARAAHELKAHDRRDDYLLEAERLAPDQPAARLMTQAELLLEQRRWQEALAALKALSASGARHPAALRLELRAQQMAHNWDQVLALVEQLEKRESIEPLQAEQLRLAAHMENFLRRAQDAQGLKEYWGKIPAGDKLNSKIALAAARNFLDLQDCAMALEIIVPSLEHRWDSDLVALYGQCTGGGVLKQVERAEKWLNEHPRDAGLLLALGRLCARQELWGKAQSYLEASLGIAPSAEACLLLAQLLEKLERKEEACRRYREGLGLALSAERH